MSGHKRARIKIGRVDNNHLAELENRLQTVERDYQSVQTKIQQSRNDHLRDSFSQLQSRQENFTHNLTGLDENLHRIEYHTTNAILEQTALFNQQISDIEFGLWQEITEVLEQQAEVIQNVLNTNLYEQQTGFYQINQMIEQQSMAQENQFKFAQEFLDTAGALLDNTAESYQLEQYIPGLFDQLLVELDLAQNNILNGMPEAGLAGAQQAYLRISSARLEIENMILQKSLLLNAVKENALDILAYLDDCQIVPAVDLEGKVLDYEVDVNHWSWGAWQSIQRECSCYLKQLNQSAEAIDLNMINKVYAKLESFREQIPLLVSEARQNVLSSQVRFNIADLIVQGLQDQGFSLTDSSYQNEDQRQPYLTTLRNYEGSQVYVQISPQPEFPLEHMIDLVSEDQHIRTHHELKQRANALKNSLGYYGLDVNFQTIQDGNESAATTSSQPTALKPIHIRQPVHNTRGD